MAATRSGDSAIVGALIRAAADPNKVTTYGYAAIHLAAKCGHASAVAALVANGVSVDLATSVPEHHRASPVLPGLPPEANESDEIVNFLDELLQQLLEKRYFHAHTPLMLAAARGHVEAVRQLLELGADRDFVPAEGPGTARQLAERASCAEVSRILSLRPRPSTPQRSGAGGATAKRARAV